MRGGDLCLEPRLPAAAVPALVESAFWGWQFGRQISWVRRQAFHLKETPSSSMATKREYRRYPDEMGGEDADSVDRRGGVICFLAILVSLVAVSSPANSRSPAMHHRFLDTPGM